MQIEAHLKNDVLTLLVRESRLDAAVATVFKDHVRHIMARGGETIILDLGQVEFMDSSGLGAMIAVLKAIPSERKLLLRGLTPNVWRVFRLTRMDQVFTMLDGDEAGPGAMFDPPVGGPARPRLDV